MKKIHVSDKLHWGTSYVAIGHEFNVYESTIILNKVSLTEIHTKWGLYWSVDDQRLMGTLSSISPRNNGSVFANSEFAVTL